MLRPAPGDEPPACSLRRPVCVHRGPGVSGDLALRALTALEQAYERVVLAMGLPHPLPDLGRGGTTGLDLYLRTAPELELVVGHDDPEAGYWDEASGFCLLHAPEGASLQRAAAQCVGEAVALRLDASEAPHLRRAYSTGLWWVAGHPTAADVQAIDDAQIHPERAVATSALDARSEGAAMFLDFLDATHSRSAPGLLTTSLLALSAGKTAPGASHWSNAPDVFDVLRASFEDQPSRMANLMAQFAVARAFVGERDDGSHLPTLGFAGAFGRVRFDWVFPLSSLPRRVASSRPIEPTGSIYVWLELDRAADNTTLALQAEWESPTEFAWVLVRVGHDGREQSRIVVPYQQRATSVDQRLVNLDGTAAVLVVGTNLGGVDASHPFDPDVAPFEGHGCTVYLTEL